MTDRQRVVARMAIVDGLRQSEIADRLGIARPDRVGRVLTRADVPRCRAFGRGRGPYHLRDGIEACGGVVRTGGPREQRSAGASWLVLAHLVADFVLQTDAIATAQVRTRAATPGHAA